MEPKQIAKLKKGKMQKSRQKIFLIQMTVGEKHGNNINESNRNDSILNLDIK